MTEKLTSLGYHLFSNDKLSRMAFRGNCRVWSTAAFLEAEKFLKNNREISLEIREKDVSLYTSHTFLRAVDGDVAYIYDGTGYSNAVGSWWGKEKNSWYSGSSLDMLNEIMRSR